MLKKSLGFFVTYIVAFFLISGCARDISSGSYDARTIGAASDTYPCVVVSTRVVHVEEGDYLESGQTGTMVGALAGGALGNVIGKGKGRVVSTIGGALLGGTAGAYAEKSIKSQKGIEYIIRLQSGAMKTIVQGMDNQLLVGQNALLIVDHRGRSRLIAQ